MIRVALVLVVVMGCSKKEKAPPTPGSAVVADAAVVAAIPDAAAAPDAPAGIDPCSFASRDDIEKAVGPLTTEPTKTPPSGAVMGGCQFELANRQVVVDVRPVGEYDATVALDKKAKPVTGIGEAAMASDQNGVMVKVAGKPYFLHVMALAGGTHDNASATRLAKLLVAGAK